MLRAVNNYDEALALLKGNLRALIAAQSALYNGFEPDNQSREYHALTAPIESVNAFLAKENAGG